MTQMMAGVQFRIVICVSRFAVYDSTLVDPSSLPSDAYSIVNLMLGSLEFRCSVKPSTSYSSNFRSLGNSVPDSNARSIETVDFNFRPLGV